MIGTRSTLSWILSILLIGLLLPLPLGAAGSELSQPFPSGEGEERGRGRMDADRLEFLERGQVLEATGNVNISYEQIWIRADHVRYDRQSGEVLAEGGVFITDGKSRLEGARLEYNTESGQGTLYQGNGFFSPFLWVTGMEIRREDEETYHLSGATLTPCPTEGEAHPDWELRAQRATVHLNEKTVARGASLWAKGIPLLYSPFLTAPAGERQSGFLIPFVGYGSKEGYIFKTSYFWAINPSQDATFSLNYRTKRGLEEGVEYRYILSKNTKGHFDGLYTYDQVDHENRWKIAYRHQQEIASNLNGKLNLNLQNTNDYQRIYDQDIEVRSQRLLPAEGYICQNWNHESLMFWGNYTKDLRIHDHLYRLPELSLLSFRQPWGGIPLHLHLNSSGDYFESYQGQDLGRFDLYPRLTLPLSLGGFATLTPLAAFRETFYTRVPGEHRSFSREIYQLQARLDSRLARTFSVEGKKIEGIRHTIEPMVAYEYIPEVDQTDLPLYDYADFISPQNGITYSLTNRLWAKFKSAEGSRLQEMLILRLSQSYNIHGPHQQAPDSLLGIAYNEMRDSLRLRFSERRFSDINAYLGVKPARSLDLALEANYDPKGNHFDTIDPSLRWEFSPYLNIRAGYHYAPELKIHAIDGKLGLKWKDKASLSYYTSYNFAQSSFVENKVELTYYGRCWSTTLGYIKRPDEQVFQFSFDLRSISGIK